MDDTSAALHEGPLHRETPTIPINGGRQIQTLAISQEEVNESESSPDGQKLANYELRLLKIEERLLAGGAPALRINFTVQAVLIPVRRQRVASVLLLFSLKNRFRYRRTCDGDEAIAADGIDCAVVI